jgi:hypothetical protein
MRQHAGGEETAERRKPQRRLPTAKGAKDDLDPFITIMMPAGYLILCRPP